MQNALSSHWQNELKNYSVCYYHYPTIQFRKIEITNSEGLMSFTIVNANYNPNLDDSLFSLANPLLN